ncbi:MAG TPA: hypothetical protein VFL63_04105 [Rhodanobacteraceae bacterium]|jgi:hypothetical protein|nr:hypothetical protein [Rhodanobacteraceae bacterium]
MPKSRVTAILFGLSDVVAWALVSLAVFLAVVSPFVMPVAARMEHATTSWPAVLVQVLGLLVLAVGAYGMTRRRPIALALLALPSVAWLFGGAWLPALVWFVAVLVIFGLPLCLAYVEVRRHVANDS